MHELLQQTIFYLFAGLTVFAALLAVLKKNPVHCVLLLVLAFISSAVLWILLESEFLALILVLVYVGAVMTLFLFVVMMLNIDNALSGNSNLRYLPIGLMLVAALVGLLIKAFPALMYRLSFGPQNASGQLYEAALSGSHSNTEAIGLVLYTQYFAAFEVAALILLVAIIASITLVHRPPQASKRQNVVAQIKTRRDDRVTLVQMKAEK